MYNVVVWGVFYYDSATRPRQMVDMAVALHFAAAAEYKMLLSEHKRIQFVSD